MQVMYVSLVTTIRLSSVASSSHSASTCVCSTFAVMQRVARVRQRQLIPVLFVVGGLGPWGFGPLEVLEPMNLL